MSIDSVHCGSCSGEPRRNAMRQSGLLRGIYGAVNFSVERFGIATISMLHRQDFSSAAVTGPRCTGTERERRYPISNMAVSSHVGIIVDHSHRTESEPGRIKQGRHNALCRVTRPINNYPVDAVLSGVQYPDDRRKHLLLEDQQERNQDERNKKWHAGKVQIQKEAEWK